MMAAPRELSPESALADAELRAHLDWVLRCILRHVVVHHHRLLQADGKLSDLFVSVHEARAAFGLPLLSLAPAPAGGAAPGRSDWPTLEEASRDVAAAVRRIEAAGGGRLSELGAIFGLDRRQLRLLVAAMAPLVSVDVARLYTFAWADFAVKQPTVGFLAELVADAPEEVAALVAELSPDGALVQKRLVRTADLSTWSPPTPLLHRVVAVPDRVVAWLERRAAGLPPGIDDAATLHEREERVPDEELCVTEALWRSFDDALRSGAAPARLLLVGVPGSGRRTLLHAVAAEAGLRLLAVDLAQLGQAQAHGGPDRFEEALREAAREALLDHAVLLLRGDELFEDEERLRQLRHVQRVIGRVLAAHPGPLAISARRVHPWLLRALPGLREVVVPEPTPDEQVEMWRRSLAAAGARGDVELPRRLVDRFNLPAGAIRAAVDEAVARSRGPGDAAGLLDVERVAEAVRLRADHALSEIAEPFTTTLTWDDVILPDELLAKLEEIVSHARHREFVLNTWNFRRMLAYGRGLSCLFSGGPGTGKTMVAAIIAQTLGRELYRVDLSRVASKWIGETEKNLARVFDEAERAQVILLFDEADSLFSSRTEVKSSNDRFANMEVNYLLQRMEAYDGMTILTTNFEKALDEAFKRRIKFRLFFPTPDAEHRAALWQAMLPAEAARERSIRFDLLGKRFEMSGGNIKNAVLRAAFAAAEAGTPITHAQLERAAVVELEELGRLIPT